MSNIHQCERCRRDFNKCEHYDNTQSVLCDHYVKPIDNSKMFRRWHKLSGRIGRTEYILTLIISIVVFFTLTTWIGGWIYLATDWLDSERNRAIYTIACAIPTLYIIIAAGIKRTHDTRVQWWYSLTPIIILFYLNIITAVIAVFGCIYLFKDKGEEGVNEHGTNPSQPYQEQIVFDNTSN